MTSYARRLVSGGKARFKDKELDLDLDLVYLTDRVIIMGYPASGLEALYRNDRAHAKRFIEHRHGLKYWVFNFCPLTENSYDAAYFHGQVSRYPFPDHHAPPLALLALAVREMDAWIFGDPERVVVVHCKAGKGRSGTLACAYLLSLETLPEAPKLQRSYSAKEWAKRRAEELMEGVESASEAEEELGQGGESDSLRPMREGAEPVSETKDGVTGSLLEPVARTSSPASLTPSSTAAGMKQSAPPSLEKVLALHTGRRMKPHKHRTTTEEGSKLKYGVSISSQRRFLQYWALLLSNTGPPGFWPLTPPTTPRPRILIHRVTLRMRVPSAPSRTTVNLLNSALSTLSRQKPAVGKVWASLARYDAAFEDLLEARERKTRDPDRGVGKANPALGEDGIGISNILENGRWDKAKMIKEFARVGSNEAVDSAGEGDRITTYTMLPIPRERWVRVEKPKTDPPLSGKNASPSAPSSTRSSMSLESIPSGNKAGAEQSPHIVLDAGREVRVKLHVGQIPMGWFWFIPSFELLSSSPQQSTAATGPSNTSSIKQTHHLRLARSELDFPLGAGAWIVDIDVEMSRVD